EWSLHVFAQRPEESPSSPAALWNCVISACGRAEAWEQALSLWAKMTGEGHEGPAPGLASASLTIRACTRASCWQAALDVFQQARSDGLHSTHAYNSALYALAAGRQWRCSLALLEEMAQRAVPMTRSTRNAALRACVGGMMRKDALAASTSALRLLQVGLRTPSTEWEAQGLSAHAELTEQELRFAAARVELHLLGESEELDFEERFGGEGAVLTGCFIADEDTRIPTLLPERSAEEAVAQLLKRGLSAYTSADVAAAAACQQAKGRS
ncbi:unnamed protein product, partial [Effrenium voratum]